MRKIILLILVCIFLAGCKADYTMIVYYRHGFVDSNRNIPCSECKQAAVSDKYSEMVKYEHIVINHKDFVKIKNYIQNMHHVPQDAKTEIPSIDSRITIVYDTLAVSFSDTYTKYGADSNDKLVYGNEEIIYTIKSLSNYYNYFDKSELTTWFPEIKKYGLPPTYKHIVYKKFTQCELNSMAIPDSITKTLISKIIFIDDKNM